MLLTDTFFELNNLDAKVNYKELFGRIPFDLEKYRYRLFWHNTVFYSEDRLTWYIYYDFCEAIKEDDEGEYAPVDNEGVYLFGADSFLYDFDLSDVYFKPKFYWIKSLEKIHLKFYYNQGVVDNALMRYNDFIQYDGYIDLTSAEYHYWVDTEHLLFLDFYKDIILEDLEDNESYSYDDPHLVDICIPKFFQVVIENNKIKLQLVENFPLYKRLWDNTIEEFLDLYLVKVDHSFFFSIMSKNFILPFILCTYYVIFITIKLLNKYYSYCDFTINNGIEGFSKYKNKQLLLLCLLILFYTLEKDYFKLLGLFSYIINPYYSTTVNPFNLIDTFNLSCTNIYSPIKCNMILLIPNDFKVYSTLYSLLHIT